MVSLLKQLLGANAGFKTVAIEGQVTMRAGRHNGQFRACGWVVSISFVASLARWAPDDHSWSSDQHIENGGCPFRMTQIHRYEVDILNAAKIINNVCNTSSQ